MDDFDAPSFSLGLDLDLDSTITPVKQHSYLTFTLIQDDDDDDFDIPPIPGPIPPTTLKRLRRGSRSQPVMTCDDEEEEIEDFSSQEDPTRGENKPPSSHPYSGCSTSKVSLNGHRILTTQSTSKSKTTQKEQATNIPAPTITKANSNSSAFPKLTVSPLRKFHLIDSESESESDSDSDFDENTAANKANSKLQNSAKNLTRSGQKRANASDSVSQGRDLWDDSYKEKRFSIPTPALDEFCEEYFRSVKKNRTDPPGTSAGNCSRDTESCVQTRLVVDNDGVHCKLDDPIPPAHQYFNNDDLRIRNLVRSRLPYFFPLGAMKGENQHSAPSVIDYRSQFNHGESSMPQAAQKTNVGSGSKRVKKISRKSNVEEVPQESGNWVNPRSSVGIPTVAGKRRVHAVSGQSSGSGHWFTSPEGKKVYISKTGQELTGRAAYGHYRKESGKGFKKSKGKRKTTVKKKSADKKKATLKKR